MNAEQVIQYMGRLPGVAGAFVIDSSGKTLSKEVPLAFDDNSIQAISVDGLNALETLRAEMPECFELRIDLALMTILIRDLNGSLLFVLIDQPKEVSSIRIAANVTSKRYQAGAQADQDEDSSSKLFSLPVSKKQKPQKEKPESGGSIWG